MAAFHVRSSCIWQRWPGPASSVFTLLVRASGSAVTPTRASLAKHRAPICLAVFARKQASLACKYGRVDGA